MHMQYAFATGAAYFANSIMTSFMNNMQQHAVSVAAIDTYCVKGVFKNDVSK